MSENLLLSLQITALGMGIVFGAIILLSAMMSLLTRFMADREVPPAREAGAPVSTTPAAVIEKEHKAQAAAVAVAMALAEQQIMQPFHEPPTALVSAWQLGMRTRQLYQKGVSVSRRVRKAG